MFLKWPCIRSEAVIYICITFIVDVIRSVNGLHDDQKTKGLRYQFESFGRLYRVELSFCRVPNTKLVKVCKIKVGSTWALSCQVCRFVVCVDKC